MIRAAQAVDIPAIIALLREGYRDTHYAFNGIAHIDVAYAKDLLLLSVFRHGEPGENATWVQVVERRGAIVGLMLATLARVYVIGNKLMASDLLFYVGSGASASDAAALAFNMIEWAKRSPQCVEIRCGTTAIHGNPERVGQMLKKFGFAPYGSIHRMEIER